MKYSTQNIVLKGKYEGSKIKEGEIIDKRYLSKKHALSPENIESYTIIDKVLYSYSPGSVETYYIIEIVWKDSDKSLISIDTSNYLDFITAMY